MLTWSKAELKKAIVEVLPVSKSGILVVHSNIFNLGVFDEEDPCEKILEIFTEIYGGNVTVIVPTYTFLADSEIYKLKDTPGTNMGTLSEYVRKFRASYRSKCPIHNHCGFGPLAANLLSSSDETVSFGQNSDFDYFVEYDVDVLLLGCSLSEGATLFHHFEALADVPYRKWISVSKKVDYSSIQQTVSVKYFARDDENWVDSFDALEVSLLKDEIITCTNFGYGKISSFSAKKSEAYFKKMLEIDPYLLVKFNNVES